MSTPRRVESLQFSPDGRYLTASSGRHDAGRDVLLWRFPTDAAALRPFQALAVGETHPPIVFSPDSRYFVMAGRRGAFRIWDVEQGTEIGSFDHEGYIAEPTFSPDGRYLAAGVVAGLGEIPSVAVWLHPLDTKNRVRHELPGHTNMITHLGFVQAADPSQQMLISSSYDATVRIWHLSPEGPTDNVTVLRAHAGPVWDFDVCENRFLATVGADGKSIIWDLGCLCPEVPIHTLRGHDGETRQVAFGDISRHLYTGGYDGTIRRWDPHGFYGLARDHGLAVHDISLLWHSSGSIGRWLVARSRDGQVRRWDLHDESLSSSEISLAGLPNFVWKHVRVNQNGQSIYVALESRERPGGGDTRQYYIKNLPGADGTAPARELQIEAVEAALSPDGKRVLVVREPKKVELYDLSADDPAESRITLEDPGDSICVACLGATGGWAVGGTGTGEIYVWDLTDTSSDPIGLDGSESAIERLYMSPNGKWLVAQAGIGLSIFGDSCGTNRAPWRSLQ